MLPVLRLAIAGCSVAGTLCIAYLGQTKAAETLTPQIQTQILNVIAARDLDKNRCIPTRRMTDLIGSHPTLAPEILEFAGRNLVSRGALLENGCTCPTELAIATINAVPDLAGPLRRVLEDRYPECDSAVETAMEQSLSGIAPGAGNTNRSADPMLLRSRPTAEACQDMSAPGCESNQLSGFSVEDSVQDPGSVADLSPELQAKILEALEADPERENQCIAANAFSALLKAHPELALAIMDFADVKLSSKGRILGDECVCPIELATATVDAIPELTVPVRRALDDRYPECTQPAADGRNGSRRLPPEPPCFETASPSC